MRFLKVAKLAKLLHKSAEQISQECNIYIYIYE